uniref:BHLH domain-containing protein n=1 Tax=Aegilops tauschii subsp. strangulata TaxID=200361 RepID=A0A453M4N6_AEGTS
KVIGKASVLDEIINYVQALERQIEVPVHEARGG